MAPKPDPKHWETLVHEGKTLYRCKVCPTRVNLFDVYKWKRHEQSQTHQASLTNYSARPLGVLELDAVAHLLASLTANRNQSPFPSHHPLLNAQPTSDVPGERAKSPLTNLDWNLDDLCEDPMPAQLSFEEQLTQDICQRTLDLLNGDISDDDDEVNPFGVESSSDEEDDSSNGVPVEEVCFDMPRKRARGNNTDPATARAWYPWQDRITCSLDILMHLPRSVFSRKQLDLLLWLLRVNKVDDVPSVARMTTLNKVLQRVVGVQTREYDGKMGHKYYVNDVGQILAQELCNPKVRPNLSFYPEDAGQNNLSEARQFSRWHELIPEETTPMVRLGTDDYYIFEPTLLRDGRFCVPFRWFTRLDPGTRRHVFYCKAWAMEVGNHDGEDGWLVHEDREFEVCESDLLLNFPKLSLNHAKYLVPSPTQIVATVDHRRVEVIQHWKRTNPVLVYTPTRSKLLTNTALGSVIRPSVQI